MSDTDTDSEGSVIFVGETHTVQLNEPQTYKTNISSGFNGPPKKTKVFKFHLEEPDTIPETEGNTFFLNQSG